MRTVIEDNKTGMKVLRQGNQFQKTHRTLDGLGMLAEWTLSIFILFFKGKCDISNCSCYRATKFLKHGMNAVDRFVEKGFIE